MEGILTGAMAVAVFALFVAVSGIAAMSFIASRGIQQTKREAFRQLSDVLDHSNVQDSRIRKSLREIEEIKERLDMLEVRVAQLSMVPPTPATSPEVPKPLSGKKPADG